MPRRAKRECRFYGCGAYQVKDGYCMDHWRPRWQRQDKASDPFYHRAAWQKFRAIILRKYPICRKCDNAVSTVAHHVKPIEDGGELLDEDNIKALCRDCHERVHGRKI